MCECVSKCAHVCVSEFWKSNRCSAVLCELYRLEEAGATAVRQRRLTDAVFTKARVCTPARTTTAEIYHQNAGHSRSKPSKQTKQADQRDDLLFFWGGGRVSANSAVTGVRTENELGDVSLSSKESPSRAVRAPCSGRPQHVVALVKVEE